MDSPAQAHSESVELLATLLSVVVFASAVLSSDECRTTKQEGKTRLEWRARTVPDIRGLRPAVGAQTAFALATLPRVMGSLWVSHLFRCSFSLHGRQGAFSVLDVPLVCNTLALLVVWLHIRGTPAPDDDGRAEDTPRMLAAEEPRKATGGDSEPWAAPASVIPYERVASWQQEDSAPISTRPVPFDVPRLFGSRTPPLSAESARLAANDDNKKSSDHPPTPDTSEVILSDLLEGQGNGGTSKSSKPLGNECRSLLPAGTLDRGSVESVDIMHVDQDDESHRLVRACMRPFQQDVTLHSLTRSGEEALMDLEFRASLPGGVQNFPAMFTVDETLPGISGTETAQRIRVLYPGVEMPVVVLSGDDADHIRSCSGVSDIVTKPITRQAVAATVSLQLRLAMLSKRDDLLKSILPESVLNQLVAGQRPTPQEHRSVSILFTDIVGYTQLASTIPTTQLINILDDMFTAFDGLTDKHGVLKVETIGDAYMAAAGHCEESAHDHAQRLINMACDMVKVVDNTTLPNGDRLQIRVGIHTGPAFTGVVGKKCPRFCFFGDTVNTASRMESTSFAQCIQVSEATMKQAQESSQGQDTFCRLPLRSIKGKGEMQTYIVKAGQWPDVLSMPMTTGGI